MSNVPYYLPKARSGYRSGHGTLVDGMIQDGLWDPHVDQHMGECAESCATQYGISRAQQDDHALETFKRANEAAMSGATGMVQHQYLSLSLSLLLLLLLLLVLSLLQAWYSITICYYQCHCYSYCYPSCYCYCSC